GSGRRSEEGEHTGGLSIPPPARGGKTGPADWTPAPEALRRKTDRPRMGGAWGVSPFAGAGEWGAGIGGCVTRGGGGALGVGGGPHPGATGQRQVLDTPTQTGSRGWLLRCSNAVGSHATFGPARESLITFVSEFVVPVARPPASPCGRHSLQPHSVGRQSL